MPNTFNLLNKRRTLLTYKSPSRAGGRYHDIVSRITGDNQAGLVPACSFPHTRFFLCGRHKRALRGGRRECYAESAVWRQGRVPRGSFLSRDQRLLEPSPITYRTHKTEHCWCRPGRRRCWCSPSVVWPPSFSAGDSRPRMRARLALCSSARAIALEREHFAL